MSVETGVDQPLDTLTFMATGWRHGSQAGCLSSIIFAGLVISFMFQIPLPGEIPTNLSNYLFFATSSAIAAGLMGVLPATIFGGIVGAVMGASFYTLRTRMASRERARVVGGLFGLLIVLPAVIFWLDSTLGLGSIITITSYPPAFIDPVLDIFAPVAIYLMLFGLCVAAGGYVGGRLWNLIVLAGLSPRE